MRRSLTQTGLHGLAVAVAVGLLAVPASAAPAPGSETAPNRLLVRGDEWSLTLSRAQIGPGEAIVQLYNGGEDAHNLRLRKARGGATRRIDVQEPGATGSLALRLHKGVRYRLWCSLPRHREAGMRATLRVRRKPVA